MKKLRMTILLVLALACVAPVVPTFAADETPDYIMDVMAHKKTYQRPSFFTKKLAILVTPEHLKNFPMHI